MTLHFFVGELFISLRNMHDYEVRMTEMAELLRLIIYNRNYSAFSGNSVIKTEVTRGVPSYGCTQYDKGSNHFHYYQYINENYFPCITGNNEMPSVVILKYLVT